MAPKTLRGTVRALIAPALALAATVGPASAPAHAAV